MLAQSVGLIRAAACEAMGGQVPIQGIPEDKAVKMRQSIQRRFLKHVGQEKAKEEKFLPEFPLRNGIT